MTYKLVGNSEAMHRVRRIVDQVCAADVDVLISGEDGTGKRHAARYLHQRSRRAEQPLVECDLSTTPPEEQEAALFGTVDRPGALLRAHGGIILLMEPSQLRPRLQEDLLEALNKRCVVLRRQSIPLDVRAISVTRRKPEHEVALGELDRDLYNRLATVPIAMPPLRERAYDVLQLADYFLTRGAERDGREPPCITAPAGRAMLGYHWPGNVRELCEALEPVTGDEVDLLDLPERVIQGHHAACITNAGQLPINGSAPATMPTLDDVERRYIREVLEAVNGNKAQASRVLGVDRRTLYRMLRKHGVDTNDAPSAASK